MSNARNNVARLAGMLVANEPRWGIKGNGTTDDSAAIQTLCNANPGKTIAFYPGTYRLGSTVTVSANNTRIIAPFGGVVFVNATTNGDAWHFTTTSTTAFSYLSGVGMSNVKIWRTTHTATAGAGVRFTGVSMGELDDVYVQDCPEGVRIIGGQLSTLRNVRIAALNMTDLSATTDSALLGVLERACAGSTWEPCYTLQITGGSIGAAYKTQAAVLVGQVDGMQVSSYYAAAGKDCVVRYKSQRNGSSIGGVHWSSCYFDAINPSTGSTNVIQVPDDGNASSLVTSISHSACDIGNSQSSAILVRKATSALNISGGQIMNSGAWAIDYGPASNGGSMSVVGTTVSNASPGAATGGILVSNCGNFLSEAKVGLGASCTGPYYQFQNTNGRISVRGNIGTASAAVSKSGTQQSYDFSPTAPVAAFTPTMTFGGAAVGMTGSFQGTYSLSGGRCVGDISIALSAKGSSTGSAAITTLPFPVASGAVATVRVSAMTSGVGDSNLVGYCDPATSSIIISKYSAGSLVTLQDVDYTNGSFIRVFFSYPV